MPTENTHSVFVVPAVRQAEPDGLRAASAVSPPPKRLPSQESVAIATLLVSTVSLAGAWLLAAPSWTSSLAHTVLIAALMIPSVALSHRFPLRVGPRRRAQIASTPSYLIAALAPPPIAITSAGLAQVSAGLATRRSREFRWSDIATDTGRWMVLALLSSIVSHTSIIASAPNPLTLALAAVVLFIGDIVTFPLLLFRMPGGPSFHIMLLALRNGGPSEAMQYVAGYLAALIVVHAWWAVFFLPLPPLAVHLLSYRAHLRLEAIRRRLEAVADTVDSRSPATKDHSRRVADLTRAVLRELQRYGPEVDLIVRAARLHDIGMVDIPDSVLNRVGPLSGEEWATIKLHPEIGADLLADYPSFRTLAPIVRHHHEWWNGAGYPHRLQGQDIPFGARVIAVVESYDAMLSGRPDRPGLSREHAASMLKAGRGIQWDGAIVDAFLRTIGEYLTVPAPLPPHDGGSVAGTSVTDTTRAMSGPSVTGSTNLLSARRLHSDGILLDRATRRVYLHGGELSLTAKAVTLLEFLMLHHDEVCHRDHLLDEIWGWDRPAATRAVDLRIAELRKALRDNPDDPRYIETRIGEGYRFLGAVEVANR